MLLCLIDLNVDISFKKCVKGKKVALNGVDTCTFKIVLNFITTVPNWIKRIVI